MLRQFERVQHEVKPPAGTVAASRFYVIEPMKLMDGYRVQVRRIGDNKIVWRCLISFDTAADFHYYHGNAIETIIGLGQSDLDKEFIK